MLFTHAPTVAFKCRTMVEIFSWCSFVLGLGVKKPSMAERKLQLDGYSMEG